MYREADRSTKGCKYECADNKKRKKDVQLILDFTNFKFSENMLSGGN
jgi:hypothetical protein